MSWTHQPGVANRPNAKFSRRSISNDLPAMDIRRGEPYRLHLRDPKTAYGGVMTLNYETKRDAHAIAEFSATMKFAGGVGAQTFANVVPLLNEAAAKLDLPAPLNIQVFNIAIGNLASPPPPLGPIGIGFQRFLPNGEVACSLLCDHESITFSLREYDRWHSVLPKIVETFSQIGQAYIAEVPAIRLFSVQYVNEFRASSPEVRCAAELFRKDSKWIAPFSYESNEPWHCHVGQFIPTDGAYRYLMNVNCDISPNVVPGEQDPKNYARVLILAASNYDLPNNGPLIVDVDSLESGIKTNFDDAHSLEKRILREIISDEYLAVMGEGAGEY